LSVVRAALVSLIFLGILGIAKRTDAQTPATPDPGAVAISHQSPVRTDTRIIGFVARHLAAIRAMQELVLGSA
jgi:hypothetical protein